MGQPRRPDRAGLVVLAATVLLAGCATGTSDGTPAPSSTPPSPPSAMHSEPATPSATGSPSTATASAGAAEPGTAEPTPRTATDTVPTCVDDDWLMADAAAYGDEPMLGDRDNDVVAWAEQFDDFAAVWGHLDRPGRLTVGFTGDDLPARQAAVREAFPGQDVAAVTVAFTNGDAEALGARVRDRFPVLVASAGGGAHRTQVQVWLAVPPLLERSVDDVVAEVAAAFPGEPLCVVVPDVPAAGPQPDGGDGWRLLASAKGAGEPYTTAIATDVPSWDDLWSSTMGDDPVPDVDFATEVAILFGDVHSGSCDHLRLDDVVVTDDVVHMDRVVLDGPICTADANPWAWFVAVDRDVLPDAPFSIQLEEKIPAPGVADQVTRVTPEVLAGTD